MCRRTGIVCSHTFHQCAEEYIVVAVYLRCYECRPAYRTDPNIVVVVCLRCNECRPAYQTLWQRVVWCVKIKKQAVRDVGPLAATSMENALVPACAVGNGGGDVPAGCCRGGVGAVVFVLWQWKCLRRGRPGDYSSVNDGRILCRRRKF